MAAKKKAPAQNPLPNRPLHFEDLTKQGREVVTHNLNEAGRNLPMNFAARAQVLKEEVEDPATEPKRLESATAELNTVQAIQPHLRPRSVSIDLAAGRRQNFYHRAVSEAQSNGGLPTGTGWYYGHHADISRDAKKHGVDVDRAIVASAVMSPANDPNNEKIAVGAMMDAYANRSVHVTPKIAKHLAGKGVPVDPAHVGQRVPFAQLHPHALPVLASTEMEGKVDTDADLGGVRHGGVTRHQRNAADVLSGAVHHDDAINPISAPKVFSYSKNIRRAVPGTAEHSEYLFRVADRVRPPQQDTLDLTGLANSKQGLLDPNSETAEDTWQHAITMGQVNRHTTPGSGTNVMKTAGTLAPGTLRKKTTSIDNIKVTAHPSGMVKTASLQHAFNNRATRLAAAREGVPPVNIQEVGWTKSREEGDKDDAFRSANRTRQAEFTNAHTQALGKHAEYAANEGKQDRFF